MSSYVVTRSYLRTFLMQNGWTYLDYVNWAPILQNPTKTLYYDTGTYRFSNTYAINNGYKSIDAGCEMIHLGKRIVFERDEANGLLMINDFLAIKYK